MCSLLPVYLCPSIFHYPANSLFRADGVESGEAWGRAIAQHSYATGHSSKGPTRGHLWLQKPGKGHFLAHLSQLFFLLKSCRLLAWSCLYNTDESGRNCGFQRKRAFLYSSFPPTPVLSSLSSAVRRKRVFLPSVPSRLEVGAGRRRGLAGKGITATVSAIHAKHGSGRDKNWRKNLIFSDMIEKHFHKCQPLPITSKAFGYKRDRILYLYLFVYLHLSVHLSLFVFATIWIVIAILLTHPWVHQWFSQKPTHDLTVVSFRLIVLKIILTLQHILDQPHPQCSKYDLS